MKQLLLTIFISIFGLALSTCGEAQPLPVKAFAKKPSYRMLKLSPDGAYFAALSEQKDQTILAILERNDKGVNNLARVYRMGSGKHIDVFYWADDRHIVFQYSEDNAMTRQRRTQGEVLSIHVEKNLISPVFGYRVGRKGTTSNVRGAKALRSHGRIVSMLRDDPKHILVMGNMWDASEESGSQLYKVNAINGRWKIVTQLPYQRMNAVFNQKGEPLLVKGISWRSEENSFVFKDKKWVKITGDITVHDYQPLSASDNNDVVYLSGYNGNTKAIYKHNLATQETSEVFRDPELDFHDLIRDPATQNIIGVKTLRNRITSHFFEPKNKFAKLHKALNSAFSGSNVSILSTTHDSKIALVLVQNDRNPGDYYLFNTETHNMDYLMSLKQWIDPQLMASKQPISFEARDGKKIYGYLTLPNVNKQAPLIVYVHGGPYGVQDTWDYEDTVQMLANNGYAVLQVNYRGSGGYGAHYERVAYRKRSSLIQQDIIDGTRWAMTQKGIDESRVCIMGSSFGGYSALMAPLIENELYDCSVAVAGVYDVVEQEKDADYALVRSLNKDIEIMYGSDEALLVKESPMTYIDNLKTPIFIVHGDKDERVPVEQAYILKEALEKRNMPYEIHIKAGEGHGFFDDDNRAEYYSKTLEFLKKHIGSVTH